MASITLTPTSFFVGGVLLGSHQNTLLVAGSGTTFTGSTITLTNVSTANASIVDQGSTTTTAAYATVDAGSIAGTATITDTSTGSTATLTLNANAATNQVVWVGNSLVARHGFPVGNDMLQTCLSYLGPTWTGSLQGISGANVTVIGAQTQIPWGSIPAPLAGRNVLFVEGMDNDYAAASPGPATSDQVYNYIRDVKRGPLQALGWEVVIWTQAPYGFSNAYIQGQIAAFNTRARANWRVDKFDNLLDFAGYGAQLDPNVTKNLNYYQSDNVHFNQKNYTDWGYLAAMLVLTSGTGGTIPQPQFAPATQRVIERTRYVPRAPRLIPAPGVSTTVIIPMRTTRQIIRTVPYRIRQ